MPSKLKVVLFTILFFASTALGASTVIELNLKDLVRISDLIVVGEIKSTRSYMENGRILTSIIVSGETILKGSAPEKIEIVQYGGKTEKFVTYVPGMPYFSVNEKVLLFLEKPKNANAYVVTGMSQGKFNIASGPDGETRFVIPASLGGMALVKPQIPLKTSESINIPSADVHHIVSSLSALSKKISELQK